MKRKPCKEEDLLLNDKTVLAITKAKEDLKNGKVYTSAQLKKSLGL